MVELVKETGERKKDYRERGSATDGKQLLVIFASAAVTELPVQC